MLGVGLGMLYTPLVVDRMQLKYPSGLAVANILRALSDPAVLRRSIAQLGTGLGLGAGLTDRKSTRLNSSHSQISYAVFCLKKKKNNTEQLRLIEVAVKYCT